MIYKVEPLEDEWILLNECVKCKFVEMIDNTASFDIVFDETILTEQEANEMVETFFSSCLKDFIKDHEKFLEP